MTVRSTGAAIRLAANLVGHEIRIQRRETLLGIVWLFVWPVVQAGGFVFAFDLIRGSHSGMRHSLDAYLGVLIWSGTATVISGNVGILRISRELITQFVFPFYILSVADVAFRFLFMLIQIAVGLAAWSWLTGGGEPLALVEVPLFLAGFFLFLLGLGWIAALAGAVAPDLVYAVPALLTLMIGLSPIFQTNPAAQPSVLRLANRLNPLAQWVDLFYGATGVRGFDPWSGIEALGYGLVTFAIALGIVRTAYRELAKLL